MQKVCCLSLKNNKIWLKTQQKITDQREQNRLTYDNGIQINSHEKVSNKNFSLNKFTNRSKEKKVVDLKKWNKETTNPEKRSYGLG